MFFHRNKGMDDQLDRTYFDHLGPQDSKGNQEYRSISHEKTWIAWGAIAACLLFHQQIPNLLLFLIIVIALCIIFKH